MDKKKVYVLGAGVAGLTVAHELITRDFDVTVIEKENFPGGKAATQYPYLAFQEAGPVRVPAEHGFRLFPSFYRHLIDTMQRIPFHRDSQPRLGYLPQPVNRDQRAYHTVADNLVATQQAATARNGYAPEPVQLAFGSDWRGMLRLSQASPLLSAQQATSADLERYALKIWQYMTSCDLRRDTIRDDSYGGLTWWEFIGGECFSSKFQIEIDTFVRSMIAMDAKRGNARTIGNVGMQLIFDAVGDGSRVDRVLNGPSSDQWLLPWEAYLRQSGVKFIYNAFIRKLGYDPARRIITSVDYEIDGVRTSQSVGDGEYVVAALPLDVMRWLMASRDSAELVRTDPQLAWIADVNTDRYFAWMAGIQYYLSRDVPVVRGHVYYPEAQWKLSSVSQAQFWGPEFFSQQLSSPGTAKPTEPFRGILSVDVCDWQGNVGARTSSAKGLTASQCTRENAAREIWEQLRYSLVGPDGQSLLPQEMPVFHFDESVRFVEALDNQDFVDELRPDVAKARPRGSMGGLYFVPPPGSHLERPKAETAIENFFLAGDYISTTTDLATMESANEAARQAVNALLRNEYRFAAESCQVWPFEELPELTEWKKFDEDLFRRGSPHGFEVAGLFGTNGGVRRAAGARLAMQMAAASAGSAAPGRGLLQQLLQSMR
jgi:15-cis-phytoene desaturase